jgi:hypothetical protein
MANLLLIALAAALTVGRLFIPTAGHSAPMIFIVVAHVFVGVMLTLLWQKRGRWALGWICLGVPTILEVAMFVLANG